MTSHVMYRVTHLLLQWGHLAAGALAGHLGREGGREGGREMLTLQHYVFLPIWPFYSGHTAPLHDRELGAQRQYPHQ